MHRFVAPTAGGYAFELTSEEDGALGVLDSSGRVLACNDDARPGRAIVHVVLERGQAIDVAVDGFGGDRGPYTLRGLRERPLEHGERLELGAPVKGDTRGALDEQRGGVRR